MDTLRVATKEEVEKFQDVADLTPTSTVVAFPNGDKLPDFAVLRQSAEVDPWFFSPETSDQRKLLFLWALKSHMALLGIQCFYFNVKVADDKFRKIIEKLGAVATSEEPEIRYRMDIR